MAKQNSEFTLPKYLKLVKGTMWLDTIGSNCSNVRLTTVNTQFVGRGYITDDDWDSYKKEGFLDQKDIPKDAFDNNSTQHGQYGYVEMEKDNSYFCTTDIPSENLGNIITAYKTGVLIEYDPDKVEKQSKEKMQEKNFTYNSDGDLIFTGKNKHMFDKLNNAGHDELVVFIKNAPPNARQNLLDLYDYELQGFNRLSRPRATVLDAIRFRLNSFGPGMSGITVEHNTVI